MGENALISAGGEPGLVGQMPYFFLSYARTPRRDLADRDDPDRWVYKLYQDLRAAILQMTSASPEEAGFMDRENRLGVEWSPELTSALATCRVFVPLYSRRYFESENCGKEWFAFARRGVNQNARGLQAVNAIVPALWTKLDQDRLPSVAQSIQYHHADLGPRYSAEGFYGIMKLQQYRSDYQRAVHRLAQRIVDVADETELQAEKPADYESLPSAFGPASIKQTAADHLQITVLAHDTSTLPEDRADHYYGSTPHTWSPYSPDYPQPLADYAMELARKCLGCQPFVVPFEYGPSGSTRNGRVVPPGLCLVDPWVTVSSAHQQRLRHLDGLDQPWVSVLVPWNSQDAQMATAQQALRDGLGKSLGNRLASVPHQCRMAATGIPTLQEFGQLLPQMTMIMLKRFRQSAPAYPPAGPQLERPRLRMADPDETGVAR